MKPVTNPVVYLPPRIFISVLHMGLLGGLGFLLLMILFLENGAWAWLRQPSDSIKIRAVMKPGVSLDATREKAADYLARVPGLHAYVVDEAEGRGHLEVQESWLQNLPETSVVPLPVVIEFRHPASGRSTTTMQTFADQLSQDPQIEFAMFDATAHDRLVRQLGVLQSHARGAKHWMYLTMLLVMMAAGGALSLAAGARPPSIFGGAVSTTGAVVIALLLYWLARGNVALATLPSLPWKLLIRGVLIMIVCFHLGHAVSTILFRRRNARS